MDPEIAHLNELLDAELVEIEEGAKSLAGQFTPSLWDQQTASYFGLGGFDDYARDQGRRLLRSAQSDYIRALQSGMSGFITSIHDTVKISPSILKGFKEKMRAEMATAYQSAYRAGALTMGNPYYRTNFALQGPDLKFVRGAIRKELSYLDDFIDKTIAMSRAGKSVVELKAISDMRLRRYGTATDAMMFSGMLAASGPQQTILWELSGAVAEHCPDCVDIASNNPYTRETLPTVPRAGDTVCRHNCHCKLKFLGGPESYRASVAELDPSAAALVTPIGGGTRVSGDIQREFSGLYDQLNILRAQLEAEIDAKLARELAQVRAALNKHIVQKAQAYGVKVLPRWSVSDIITNVRSLESQGMSLMTRVREFYMQQQVYFVRGGALEVARVSEISFDIVEFTFKDGHRFTFDQAELRNLAVFGKKGVSLRYEGYTSFEKAAQGGIEQAHNMFKLEEMNTQWEGFVDEYLDSGTLDILEYDKTRKALMDFDMTSAAWKEHSPAVFDRYFERSSFDEWVRNALWGNSGGWSSSSGNISSTVLKGITEAMEKIRTSYHYGREVQALAQGGLRATESYKNCLGELHRTFASKVARDGRLKAVFGLPGDATAADVLSAISEEQFEKAVAEALARQREIGRKVLQQAIAKNKLKLTADGKIVCWRGTTGEETAHLRTLISQASLDEIVVMDIPSLKGKSLKEILGNEELKRVFADVASSFEVEVVVNTGEVQLNSLTSVSFTPKHWKSFGSGEMISFEVDPADIMYGEHLGRLLKEDEFVIANRKHRLKEAILKMRTSHFVNLPTRLMGDVRVNVVVK